MRHNLKTYERVQYVHAGTRTTSSSTTVLPAGAVPEGTWCILCNTASLALLHQQVPESNEKTTATSLKLTVWNLKYSTASWYLVHSLPHIPVRS